MFKRLPLALFSALLLSVLGGLAWWAGVLYPPIELNGVLTRALGTPEMFRIIHSIFGVGQDGKNIAFVGTTLLWLALTVALGFLPVLLAAPLLGLGLLFLVPWPVALGYGVVYALIRLALTPFKTNSSRATLASTSLSRAGRRNALVTLGGVGVALLGAGITRGSRTGAVDLTLPSAPGKLPTGFTPVKDFFYVSKNLEILDPKIKAANWTLEVNGEVQRPQSFTLEELRALPSQTVDLTLACISNPVGGPLLGLGRWTGVSFAEILKRVGLTANAKWIVWHAADGYTESLPLSEAASLELLLAYEQNGAPLTPKHGFPLRILIPGRYGMKQPRWLTRIEFAAEDRAGYWVTRGWSKTAFVELTSRIDSPLENSPVVKAAQPIQIEGIAFGGLLPITKVEVSTDGGQNWLEAQLEKPVSKYAWTLWSLLWTPEAGSHELKVRSYSSEKVQKEQEEDALPEGATGYHHFIVNAS
ncbi:MAG: molybdopterin-dependent oxidoreductase [Pseudopedobacter sp.]|nr:molybdopterin-dependent oxidoreductase [Deinococcales bacterium]